jgi:hypothetical protein
MMIVQKLSMMTSSSTISLTISTPPLSVSPQLDSSSKLPTTNHSVNPSPMKSQVRESSERSDDILTSTNSPISNSMKNQIYNTLKKDIMILVSDDSPLRILYIGK